MFCTGGSALRTSGIGASPAGDPTGYGGEALVATGTATATCTATAARAAEDAGRRKALSSANQFVRQTSGRASPSGAGSSQTR